MVVVEDSGDGGGGGCEGGRDRDGDGDEVVVVGCGDSGDCILVDVVVQVELVEEVVVVIMVT